MSLRIAATWFLRGIDIVLVAVPAYLCWTLVWCGGPFERMGWIFPAFFVGPPLLLISAVYFGVCAARRRRVVIPPAAIAGVVALSVLLNCWIGSYPATVHTNSSGTVLIKFENSWDGLLYVPAGMESPDRDGDLRIGPEVLPRWWYYNTD